MTVRPTLPTAADVVAAHQRLRGLVHAAPVTHEPRLGNLLLAWENEQPTGSYKLRGAMHHVVRLTSGESPPPQGVVTASSGNHGLAVALAATERGLPAAVVMRTTAHPYKVGLVQATGVE